MKIVSSRVLFVVSVACTSLVAGCSGATPASTTTPTSADRRGPVAPPSAEARRLAAVFEGTWKGKATFTMEGKASAMDIEAQCTGASAGWGTTCEVTCVDGGGGLHHESHLIGYSADGAKVHLFSVTTDGDTHDHSGTFTDRGVAVEYRGTAGDKPMVETLSFERTDAKTLRFRNDTTVGGEPLLTLDVNLHK